MMKTFFIWTFFIFYRQYKNTNNDRESIFDTAVGFSITLYLLNIYSILLWVSYLLGGTYKEVMFYMFTNGFAISVLTISITATIIFSILRLKRIGAISAWEIEMENNMHFKKYGILVNIVYLILSFLFFMLSIYLVFLRPKLEQGLFLIF
ncbi:hypothetical protein [Thalassomonas sp. M1454]|uniref:hypothetical protein n=1 Tax=Thalassomonas sp. M1454 TaxID=2594477 RepID=UPI00117C28E8|nr:hypothetical protein [Thalassomonas sp. M1454]TRX53453.1 hypothetical protein FNN08_14360 [Thalassomonas sp. M1454]